MRTNNLNILKMLTDCLGIDSLNNLKIGIDCEIDFNFRSSCLTVSNKRDYKDCQTIFIDLEIIREFLFSYIGSCCGDDTLELRASLLEVSIEDLDLFYSKQRFVNFGSDERHEFLMKEWCPNMEKISREWNSEDLLNNLKELGVNI